MTTVLPALALALAVADGLVAVAAPEGPEGGPGGWIGAAVAETLPRSLARAGVPAVTGADLRRAEEALGVPSPRPTRATAIRVAETLGASRLVVGEWELRGSDVSLSLRLVDTRRGTLSAPIVERGPLSSLGRLVQSLAWDVALAGSQVPTGGRESLLRAAEAVPFEALRALGEGLAARETAARVAGLRRALAVHPRYDEAALALARLQVDAGSFEEARRVLARVHPESDFTREARFLDGVALIGLGRFQDADPVFGELAERLPTAAALSNRAITRLRLGAGPGETAGLLWKAVEAEPASVDLPFNLGWALLAEGDAEAAAFWLRGAVHRNPGDAQGRLVLSWALEASGRSDEAEEQWRAAASLSPALEAQRRYDPARRVERVLPSERGLVLDPGRAADAEAARAYVDEGGRRLASGDLDGAVSALTRASLLDPYAPLPHRLLARAHRGRGDRGAAIAELRKALWCRDDAVVRHELAELLREAGRPEEASRVLGPS